MVSMRWVAMGLAALLVCGCGSSMGEPPPDDEVVPFQASPSQVPEADTSQSASLAGVSRWADAEPADLASETTYALPGRIHPDISLDNLRITFGAANVELAELPGAEGETFRGVVLFAADPERRAELSFRNEERQSGVDMVRVREAKSRWHLASGVTPGMTLDQVVQANAAPVSFSGLDWDYGGNITDWHGGKAGAGSVRELVRLGHAEEAKGYPVGENTFRSDDTRYPAQGSQLRVDEIGVTFDN